MHQPTYIFVTFLLTRTYIEISKETIGLDALVPSDLHCVCVRTYVLVVTTTTTTTTMTMKYKSTEFVGCAVRGCVCHECDGSLSGLAMETVSCN